MRMITLQIAASALVIGLTTVGCQSDDSRPFALSDKAPQAKRDAFGLQQQAQAALRAGNLQSALTLMEEAVALSPRDAGYRMSLAELYMRSGRFASAERTFSDTVILNPDNVQASLYLALSRAAQGRMLAAETALAAIEGRGKTADLGLAYALIGMGERAIALLEPAARETGADARVRQNLALSYALTGDWAKARIIAAQDMSPADVDRRLEQWAALAQPNASGVQVAAFFGVTPTQDSGQPLRLALDMPEQFMMPKQDAMVAEAEPEPAPEPIRPSVTLASSVTAQTELPAAPVNDAPNPLFDKVRKSIQVPGAILRNEWSRTRGATQANEAAQAGKYVVQIGSFKTRAQAGTAWREATRRYGFNADSHVVTIFNAPDGKGLFYRLAVRGYTTQSEANGVCRMIKSKGGDCFVRVAEDGRAITRIASRR
ncbi:SPOR domain-containing protein [Allosphingosinicella flava]|uniref:SPOR domain-containing protein n=1 Tax=Allosphingosinicella flava TaxID=2771430 RepID=A0A7T2GKH9_9SPHN|nr:SPOR domain-containing protein [Sphingosinicella flava]QPQ55536.1 SPOR domain-containing protein [Sphingosinicella flava]